VTKQEFVDQVASKSGLSRRDAAKAVDAFLESVTETLKRGDQVSFTGFGW
jgi:DNA-binding protein HU-beta